MQTPLIALVLALAGTPQQQPAPARATPPEPLSATPLRIPADFCFGASATDKSCTAAVSFEVLDSGAVGKLKVIRSSRDRICDRAVMETVRSRRYPSGKPFAVVHETLRSPSCKADGLKR
ncbi:energy transducer TonB [Xanthomonas sp. AM6]|uniref:energy transducer TonB n=1 Tax=Xanthomonas sp. AM6 TaxID=2982531 RepID=UPI0021D81B56|nr:energy transducer TonB [Xanthomonas sp. AM6]UYB51285.1 energy transducer TonB [Xanthomonas sp. AM6]